MKRFIFFYVFVFFAFACSSNDDSDSEPSQREPGEPSSIVEVAGSSFGTTSITFDDFDGFPIGERYVMYLEAGSNFDLDVYMLTEGGFEAGTVKTITVSSNTHTNEVIFYDYVNNLGQDSYESISGTITITDNIPYEIPGGNGSGIYLSGDFEITLEKYGSSGEEISIIGGFTDVRFGLQ